MPPKRPARGNTVMIWSDTLSNEGKQVMDEFQAEAHPDISKELGEVFSDSIRQAGEYYKLRVPLAGESAVGMRWSETH